MWTYGLKSCSTSGACKIEWNAFKYEFSSSSFKSQILFFFFAGTLKLLSFSILETFLDLSLVDRVFSSGLHSFSWKEMDSLLAAFIFSRYPRDKCIYWNDYLQSLQCCFKFFLGLIKTLLLEYHWLSPLVLHCVVFAFYFPYSTEEVHACVSESCKDVIIVHVEVIKIYCMYFRIYVLLSVTWLLLWPSTSQRQNLNLLSDRASMVLGVENKLSAEWRDFSWISWTFPGISALNNQPLIFRLAALIPDVSTSGNINFCHAL